MAPEPCFQPQARAVENLRIEVATVVDDDQHRSPRTQRTARTGEHRRNAVAVRGERATARSPGRGTQLEAAQILELEQLVRRSVLLVVVDQARVGRRGDD